MLTDALVGSHSSQYDTKRRIHDKGFQFIKLTRPGEPRLSINLFLTSLRCVRSNSDSQLYAKCYRQGTTHARWRIHRTLLYSRHHVAGATADMMLQYDFVFHIKWSKR